MAMPKAPGCTGGTLVARSTEQPRRQGGGADCCWARRSRRVHASSMSRASSPPPPTVPAASDWRRGVPVARPATVARGPLAQPPHGREGRLDGRFPSSALDFVAAPAGKAGDAGAVAPPSGASQPAHWAPPARVAPPPACLTALATAASPSYRGARPLPCERAAARRSQRLLQYSVLRVHARPASLCAPAAACDVPPSTRDSLHPPIHPRTAPAEPEAPNLVT